jgi:uncharacterized membrane protein YkvA (DUF1232 family)
VGYVNIPLIGEVQTGGMGKIILFFLSILYIVSPIDFIPDFLPGIGWVDDIIVGIIGVLPMFRDLIRRK